MAKRDDQSESDLPAKLGAPAERALANAGIHTLKQLSKFSEVEVKNLHGVGPNALGKLHSALAAKGLFFASEKQTKGKKRSGTSVNSEKVDKFIDELDHPLKAEVQMLREIIRNVNKDLTEQIKWNAPTFSYKGEYLVTFNLWEKKKIHLVFHNPMISKVKSTLLEGDYDHRRMAYFSDKKDIQAKKPALEKALKDLIKLQDK